MGKYYDGTKLLSMKDLDGNKPEVYICTSNRSAGKTTWFNRRAIKRFLDKGLKFGMLYRFSYEIDDAADKVFRDVGSLFFPDMVMTQKKVGRNAYAELSLDGEPCGYAIAINSADQIKRYSHLMSDVDCLIFDEFQSEVNKYCSNEVEKFISIHTSLARGNGQQSRYLPVFMISNMVSLLNPYYSALGIANRLQAETKFLRGNGWVLEQGHVEAASAAQKSSTFNKAFEGQRYLAYAAENVYLNDSKAFIEEPKGRGNYICTLRYGGSDYGILEYLDEGIVYCGTHADRTNPFRISVTTDDHNVNYVMLNRNNIMITTLRYYFERGCVRFHDLRCKEAFMRMVSY